MKRLFYVACCCAMLSLHVAHSARAAEITVFGAASLTDALQEIGKRYETRSGDRVRFSFAASSTLARQIEAGANANLFVSADEQWMDYLAERKLIVATSRVDLLGNRLVLIVPADSRVTVDVKPGFDLAGLLKDGRLATGDPAHVPVGKYAQEALTALGVWNVAEPKLARADSVRSALAFVERGEAPLGIVYATDAALTAKVRVAGMFPENSHKPVVYPMALVAGHASTSASAFYDFLRGDDAHAIFRKFGFSVK